MGYTVNWNQNTATVDLIGRGTAGNTPTPNDGGTPNNTTTYVNMIDVHAPYSISTDWEVKYYPTSGTGSITMGGTSYKNSIALRGGGGGQSASFNLAGKYTMLNGVFWAG